MIGENLRLEGHKAIAYASAHNMTLCKYNDPIEGEREGLTVDEAEDVAREDARLIYLDVMVQPPQPTMANVITYQNANDIYCNLTLQQAEKLEAAGLWIRNEGGYLSLISHGLHWGEPDFTDEQITSLINGQIVDGLVTS